MGSLRVLCVSLTHYSMGNDLLIGTVGYTVVVGAVGALAKARTCRTR